MPIDIQCNECKKKFRVADKFAGRRIKCPNCQNPIVVQSAESAEDQPDKSDAGEKASSSDIAKTAEPQASESSAVQQRSQSEPSSAPAEAGSQSDLNLSAEDGQWYMQTDDGEQYGPVDREELNEWLAEGRIDATCQLLCDGWDQWQWADEVFPELSEEASTEDAPLAGIADSGKDIAPTPSGASDTKLAGRPAAPSGGIERTLAETRPWVLLMAIVGFVLAGFGALGGLVMFALAAFSGQILVLLPALILLVTNGLLGWGAFLLFAYAQRIGAYIATGGAAELEQALVAQRSFWRLAGILVLVAVGLWLATGLLSTVLMLVLGG